jgi:hypothetical protein
MIHRRSKIARLPEPVITQINEFLDSDAEYQRILDYIRQQGHDGIEMYHLSRWKESGYSDWVAKEAHRDDLQRKMDWIDKLSGQGSTKLQKASMAMLALKLFEALSRTDTADMSKLLDQRPDKIPALINCFSRFSHESLEMEKFSDFLAQQEKAASNAQLVDKGAPSTETLLRMKQELRIFFRKLMTHLGPETASATASPVQEPQPLAPTCT